MVTPALKGHLVEISRFREILGRPLVNGDVERDWRALEMRSGVILPEDYKQFVTAYGPGCVNDQLYVFHPRAAGGDEGLRLESLWDQASYAYSDLARNAPEMYPYPVHPAPGGCVPIARSTSGNHVLLAPPEIDGGGWSVVLDMGQWIQLRMSFTDFLWKALQGELDIPVIEGEPTFEPVGVVEE
ncbi:SMI1/KNR4 family protein [Streptomyces ferrugineus]|uniref:SMI1/KNR4 family protein n=1 Tax=Streptomyces ferrugineus TaxID=1413221 RepID=A0A7M2SLS9_9ACTN|nr:SMI1/KNR4 family protein [Streptomyces ferrugineus]QOV36171.1 SMI1/KNR4 family protein [Streptomyces ferrugineus]